MQYLRTAWAQKYLGIHSFIIIFSLAIWLALYPGYFSPDSLSIVQDVKNNNRPGIHGIFWYEYVHVTSFLGNYISLSTLINLLIFNFSIFFFSKSFFEKKFSFIAVIVILFPATWTFGLTLWHDVPFTSGTLLIVAITKKWMQSRTKMKISEICFFFLGIYFVLTRYNGIIIVSFFCIYVLFKLGRKNPIFLRSILVYGLFVVTMYFSTLSTTYLKNFNNASVYFMRSDISCLIAQKPDLISEFIDEKNFRDWESLSACTWFNDSKLEKNYLLEVSKVRGLFQEIFLNHPVEVLNMHYKRNEYMMNPLSALQSPAPFLHTVNDLNSSRGLLGTNIYSMANDISRSMNYLRFLIANLPLSIVVFSVIFYMRRPKYLFFGTLCVLLFVPIFVTAPTPDSRLVYPLLILVQMYVVRSLMVSVRLFRSRWRAHP